MSLLSFLSLAVTAPIYHQYLLLPLLLLFILGPARLVALWPTPYILLSTLSHLLLPTFLSLHKFVSIFQDWVTGTRPSQNKTPLGLAASLCMYECYVTSLVYAVVSGTATALFAATVPVPVPIPTTVSVVITAPLATLILSVPPTPFLPIPLSLQLSCSETGI